MNNDTRNVKIDCCLDQSWLVNVTSVRCGCLRGVWLGHTGPSLPRLLPNPLSAPTTHSYAPRRNRRPELSLGPGSARRSYLTSGSDRLQKHALLNWGNLSGRFPTQNPGNPGRTSLDLLGEPRHVRTFRNMFGKHNASRM